MKTPRLPKAFSLLPARRQFLNWKASVHRLRAPGLQLGMAMLASSSLLFAGSLRAVANTEFDVASETTAQPSLQAAATYTNNAVPGTTGDLTFNATNNYSVAAATGQTPSTGGFIAGAGAFGIGTLNDLSTSQAITIQNGNSNTQEPITLNGGTDSVAGSAAGDLIFVATGANLTVSNLKPSTNAPTNTINLVLGTSGNFDIAGTATISVPIDSGTVSAPTANANGITKTGAGTLTLTNVANNFTGGTTVNAGTLALGTGGGTGIVRGTVTVNTGANLVLTGSNALGYNTGASVTTLNVNGGTVDSSAAGTAVTVNQGLLASFNLTGGAVTSTGGGSYNFNVAAATPPTITSNASATTSTISAPIVIRNTGTLAFTVASNAASGTTNVSDLTVSGTILKDNVTTTSVGGISKAGAGILTLTGANTYNGTTTVTAGTLAVASGGTLGSGAVTVNSGGTLLTSGTGTLGAGTSVTIAGTGALTLGNSASLSSSQTLNFAGTTTITLNNTSTDTLGNIVDTDGTSTFTPVQGTTYTAAQLDTDFGVNSFTGSGSLTIAVVPEPSTWTSCLVLLGGAFVVARRRLTGARLG